MLVTNRRDYYVIYRGANYTLSRNALAKFKYEELLLRLTIPNPEREAWEKYGGSYSIGPETHISFLKENNGDLIVPRNYPIDEVLLPFLDHTTLKYEDITCDGVECKNVKFNGKLKEYQIEYMDDITGGHHDVQPYDIVMNVYAGGGKTVLALYRSVMIGVTTLILVPDNNLAEQWEQRCNMFLTNARVLRLKATDRKVIHLDYYDYVILTLGTFTARDWPHYFYSHFGHVILDEAHRAGASTYLPILSEIPAKYRTMLTATTRRKDGLYQILQYHFGEVYSLRSTAVTTIVPYTTEVCPVYLLNLDAIYRSDKKELYTPFLVRYVSLLELLGFEPKQYGNILELNTNGIKVAEDVLEYINPKTNIPPELKKAIRFFTSFFSAKHEVSLFETYLVVNANRNRYFWALIKNALENNRCVLVLSKRRKILELFHQYAVQQGIKSACILGGSSKDKKNLEYAQNEAQVIFGIDKLAKEGLDIPRLDTCILLHPLTDTEQARGRIEREYKGKKEPIMVYPLDGGIGNSMFRLSAKYNGNSKVLRPQSFTQVKELLVK